MKTTFFFTFFMCIMSLCFAQDSLSSLKRLRIDEFGLQLTLLAETGRPINMAEVKTIAPMNSMLYEADLSKYDLGIYGRRNIQTNTSPVLSIYTGFVFLNKQKTAYRQNQQFRAGLSYYQRDYSTSAQTVNKTPYDTLYSGSTGNIIFIDSLKARTYNANYSGHQLRLDLSFLISTNREKRIYLYTGAGITAGTSMGSSVSVRYYVSNTVYGSNERYGNFFPGAALDNVFVKSESFKLRNYTLGANVPLGADIRLGSKRKFWRRLHAHYEVRPGVSILFISKLDPKASFAFQHGWGIKFRL